MPFSSPLLFPSPPLLFRSNLYIDLSVFTCQLTVFFCLLLAVYYPLPVFCFQSPIISVQSLQCFMYTCENKLLYVCFIHFLPSPGYITLLYCLFLLKLIKSLCFMAQFINPNFSSALPIILHFHSGHHQSKQQQYPAKFFN